MIKLLRQRIKLATLALALVSLVACAPYSEQSTTSKSSPQQLADVNIRLGLAYLKQGNNPRAKVKLLTALNYAPDYPRAQDAMGFFLERTGETEEAGRYYRQALALAPNEGETQNNYGTYLCRKKDYRESLKYFERAVEDSNYINTAGAYENAGLCALEIPNKTLAKQYFNKAIEHDGQRAKSFYELASMSFEAGDFKDALSNYSKFSSLSGQDAQSLWLGVQVARRVGRFHLAERYGIQLAEQFPKSKQYQHYLKSKG